MLVPEYIVGYFDIYEAKESKTSWFIDLYEKEGQIPKELEKHTDVVFDGYCNPIEIVSYSFVCKPIYLKYMGEDINKQAWVSITAMYIT
jgi:hypothetical protein